MATGEKVGKDTIDAWHGRVCFSDGRGPAEECVVNTLQHQSPNDTTLTIDRAVGGCYRMVNAEDLQRHAPRGCVSGVVI
ncbi:hypothetical protein LX32DRAFT_702611 [Colletotrichum zoysiae]|uniref:Uncharacterized protein n=1 Tax=Colletotrichum zoysiae TaxID=1216348 RepID=A0AAD9M1F5_9PEZI|nr:hypothetical protein LX32DRAFT_702611 [Colletotrichum zoysiae]